MPADRRLARLRRVLPVVKFLWQNKKTEIALASGLIALGREIVQAATGH